MSTASLPTTARVFFRLGPLVFYRSDIGAGGSYVHRWILSTPLGMVRLHHILRSDNARDLHDHPFDFVSILLTGGYREVRFLDELTAGPVRESRHIPRWSVVFRRAEDAHAIVLDKPVWTLVLASPKRRSWGFWTHEGWVDHRAYGGEA